MQFLLPWPRPLYLPSVKSLENTCHPWALLRWWFTTKRRYIKCMHLYLYSWLDNKKGIRPVKTSSEMPRGSPLWDASYHVVISGIIGWWAEAESCSSSIISMIRLLLLAMAVSSVHLSGCPTLCTSLLYIVAKCWQFIQLSWLLFWLWLLNTQRGFQSASDFS